MNDSAVAYEEATLRYRDDLAEGAYPVLQRHDSESRWIMEDRLSHSAGLTANRAVSTSGLR